MPFFQYFSPLGVDEAENGHAGMLDEFLTAEPTWPKIVSSTMRRKLPNHLHRFDLQPVLFKVVKTSLRMPTCRCLISLAMFLVGSNVKGKRVRVRF
jgi:hypothetical protein